MFEKNRWQLPLISIAAGALAGEAVHELARWAPAMQQTLGLMFLGIGGFSIVVVVLGSLSQYRRVAVVPLTLVGVSVAVFVDAMTEPAQNLWPFDIVFWWLVSVVPMTCAFYVAKALQRKAG